MSLIRQFLLILLLAGAGIGGWVYLKPLLAPPDDRPASGSAAVNRPVAVVIADISPAEERVRVEAVGTARATQSASLHSPTAGQVQAINFTADARVERGDVLLELDRETEELAVDLAQVRVAEAKRIFDRLQRLSATGAAAPASLDDSQTRLEAARIELRRAEVALAERFVVAPFGGRIGLTEFDVGDRIGPDSEIATLDDRAALLVRFEVPEALLGRILVGETVTVAPWSDGGMEVQGTVFDVGSRVAASTRTFVVRARIPNTDDALRPGMSFRVTVDVFGNQHPKVPESAIQWGGDGSFLWAVRDRIAHQIPVAIVQRLGADILVQGALEIGDQVVVEGLHRMRDGVRIDILPATATEHPPIPAALQGAGS